MKQFICIIGLIVFLEPGLAVDPKILAPLGRSRVGGQCRVRDLNLADAVRLGDHPGSDARNWIVIAAAVDGRAGTHRRDALEIVEEEHPQGRFVRDKDGEALAGQQEQRDQCDDRDTDATRP